MKKNVKKISITCRKFGRRKIEGTKNTFEKDKTFIQRKANSNENNASNTEENSNKRNEERRDIHLIQGETIHTTKIKIDPKMEATIKIPQKTTIANVIHHAKGNT